MFLFYALPDFFFLRATFTILVNLIGLKIFEVISVKKKNNNRYLSVATLYTPVRCDDLQRRKRLHCKSKQTAG